MPDIDLDAIKARIAAATVPPWYSPAEQDAQYRDPRNVYIGDTIGIVASAIFKSDADLIAHAPEDLAALVAEVKRLRAVAEEARRLQRRIAGDDSWIRLGAALNALDAGGGAS